jgi:hypothetical protein
MVKGTGDIGVNILMFDAIAIKTGIIIRLYNFTFNKLNDNKKDFFKENVEDKLYIMFSFFYFE